MSLLRGSRVGVAIPAEPQHPDEQDDAGASHLPRHDAQHPGRHDDGHGQAVPHGLQAPARHAPGPDPETAATGQTGESVCTV